MTAPKSSIRVGTGTGNPAGFADFKPLNAHGRAMPKITRPMPTEREGKPAEVDLYQLWVKTKAGHLLAIGPKATKAFFEPLIMNINAQIALGNEKNWREPHLLPAAPSLAVN